MKFTKSLIYSSLFVPITIAPITATSCSVFKDVFSKQYKPDYEQLSGNLTFDQGFEKWLSKAKSTPNFITEEMYYSNSVAAQWNGGGDISEAYKLSYKGHFEKYLVNIAYAKISNESEKRLSFKLNAEIDEKDEYYLDGVDTGYGINHYSIELEIKNLAFNATEEYSKDWKKSFWLIKPVKYGYPEESWTDWLSDGESVSYNVRNVTEIYDKDGIQGYGFETTEAGYMDERISYVPTVSDILDYFICVWSYYLDPCTMVK